MNSMYSRRPYEKATCRANGRPAGGRGETVDVHPSEEDRGKTGLTVKRLLRRSLSQNTRTAYASGWRRFAVYCNERGTDPMAATADEVAAFVVKLASEPRSPSATTRKGEPLALGSIRICLAAISRMYREHDRESPARHSTVAGVLQGLERLSAGRRRRVKALREHEVARILSHCDALARRRCYRTIGTRDAAVIAVGFAGALRRSEICGLRLGDVQFLGAPPRRGACSCTSGSRRRTRKAGARESRYRTDRRCSRSGGCGDGWPCPASRGGPCSSRCGAADGCREGRSAARTFPAW